MSDNELDNLFKEAAEGFTPPQDASAWGQMASMLDKTPAGAAGFWNWKTISALTATGIIATTAIWFTVTNTTNNREVISKTQEQNGSNSATQGVVQEQKEQQNPTGKENFAPPQPVENQSNRTRAVAVEKKGTTKGSSQQSSSGNGNVSSESTTDLQSFSPEAESIVVPVEVELTPGITKSDNSEQTQSSETSVHQAEQLLKPDSSINDTHKLKVDSAEDVPKTIDKDDDKAVSARRVSIKATVSPDFSSVDFFSAGKTGINFGLLAGYSFNKRWSVYTGVISSRKLYDTRDVEGSYNWEGHDYPMKELDGDCRILDIPINIYYTFFPDKSFSLRAGIGFSSYIMRKEKYVYCVDNYGDNAYYEQNIKGENNEWFKVMNLSVVVSKKFTNRISAEFEPFVKAPLAGVGEGKVSLVSMGAFINLKYDLFILK